MIPKVAPKTYLSHLKITLKLSNITYKEAQTPIHEFQQNVETKLSN
jgi:hypothetical protein